MKFISVHHGDQTTELWSNVPRSIIETLRSMGHQVELINHLLPRSTPLLAFKKRFYQYILGKVYNHARDPRLHRARASRLNRRIAALGPADAVLFTFPPDASCVQTPYPVFIIHDATWASALDYYTPSADLARETITGGLKVDKLALERCTVAIYSSQWAIDSAVQNYGIPRSKLRMAPLGANLSPPPTRDEMAACLPRRGHGVMKLLLVGQYWDRKGGDTAVEVCRIIEQRGVPVELHVVGCAPPGEAPSFVHLHGRLDKMVPAEKQLFYDLFCASDFFLLPTRAEAFGIVFGEAAAFGVPVLTFDTGGTSEAVAPAWSVAFPVGTPPVDFAEWALRNYRDRAAYEHMAWAARDDFEQRLSWDHMCRTIVDLAIENRPATAAINDEAA